MERIGILGLSLHDADLEALEALARPAPERHEAFVRVLADELAASELVLLLTCNRVEVIYARELGHDPCPSDRERLAARLGLPAGDERVARMHFHAGVHAARYLFRVACSLDSLVVGEDQILAQTRGAFAASERCGLVGRLLGTLFEHAFQVGKQVRTETELSHVSVSVAALGLQEIRRRFAPGKARVALLGAGDVAELVVRGAEEHGLEIEVVANRTLSRARRLAERCGARAQTLSEFLARPRSFDVLVTATAAAHYVLDRSALLAFAACSASMRPLVALDFSLPRNVEPPLDERVELLDLETLRSASETNRARRAAAAQQAEALVEQKLATFVRRAAEGALAEILAEVRGESEHVFERELAQLFDGRLARLDADDRRAIERWARTAFGRVNHVPINAIKRLANDRSLFAEPRGELPA